MQETLINTKTSKDLYSKSCKLIPGGVNSPVRSFKAVGGEPLFISKAKGPYIWDVDQNQYIDFVCSWGALINGHAHPDIIEACKNALEKGTSFGAPHENEIELARLIINNYPSVEKVRLVNSGTEAVMTAIRLARAYTKKNKIIKFAGCYHGHADSVLSVSGSGVATLGLNTIPGITKNTNEETVVLPYNDPVTLEITLSKNPDSIACIIVEPVCGNSGVILPHTDFLKTLRELTTKYNCLLIFDEVITGFRLSVGGAQAKYNITPDLTTFGKIIGGGMPIGAVGGQKEIMDLLAPEGPVYQAGTLSGNPVSVACGIASIKLLNEKIYLDLKEKTSFLCDSMERINRELDLKIQINKTGSMFSIFFTENKVYDYSSAQKSNTKIFSKFFNNMLSYGIYLAPGQFEANFVSTAHKDSDIKKTLEAYKKAIGKTLS